MKKNFFILSIIIILALIFTGCGNTAGGNSNNSTHNSSGNSSGGTSGNTATVVAIFSRDMSSGIADKFTFYSNNTCDIRYQGTVQNNGESISIDLIYAICTYTGNPNSDGNLYLSPTKYVDSDGFNTLLQSGATSITNEDLPLENYNDTDRIDTLTISGNTLTWGEDYYTRVTN